MADKVTLKKKMRDNSIWFTLLKAVLYAVMLLLVLMYFDGNGEFLYEI